MDNNFHITVLQKEVLDYLKVERGKWYLDATLGDAGHAVEILKKGGNVVGFDVDQDALKRSAERIARLSKDDSLKELGQFKQVEGNFRNLDQLVPDLTFDGMIFDLGVSTFQLTEGSRGFSITREGPLDMRMTQALSVNAADLVNGLNSGELSLLFQKFGELSSWEAKKVAEAIIDFRPIRTTGQLAGIVEKVFSRKRWGKIHPATTVFQALRIAVNDELESITVGLPLAFSRLNKGARLAVISFHSLEDRIVKNLFNEWEDQGNGLKLTDKPVTPDDSEIAINNKARSAKLRVIEKI